MIAHIDEQEVEVILEAINLVLPGKRTSPGTVNEYHPFGSFINNVLGVVQEVLQRQLLLAVAV